MATIDNPTQRYSSIQIFKDQNAQNNGQRKGKIVNKNNDEWKFNQSNLKHKHLEDQ